MIREEGKYLHWIHYAQPRTSLMSVYLSCRNSRRIPLMQRREKKHLWIDLTQEKEDILGGYSSNTRNEIRRFEGRNWSIRRDQQIEEIASLYRSIRNAKGLSTTIEHFSRKPSDRICSRIYDDSLGLLAAHLYLPDEEQDLIYLDYNASAFRKSKKHRFRQLCAKANRFLFWKDMLHFKQEGSITLDLGRYESPERVSDELKGVYRFKESFGGRSVRLFDYYPSWYVSYRSIKKAVS